MNADGMPSLRFQTVWVYSVRGLLESDASDCSANRTPHASAQKESIRQPVSGNRMGTLLSDSNPELRQLRRSVVTPRKRAMIVHRDSKLVLIYTVRTRSARDP